MKLLVRALVVSGIAASTFAAPAAHAVDAGPVCASTKTVVTMIKQYVTAGITAEVVCVTMV